MLWRDSAVISTQNLGHRCPNKVELNVTRQPNLLYLQWHGHYTESLHILERNKGTAMQRACSLLVCTQNKARSPLLVLPYKLLPPCANKRYNINVKIRSL